MIFLGMCLTIIICPWCLTHAHLELLENDNKECVAAIINVRWPSCKDAHVQNAIFWGVCEVKTCEDLEHAFSVSNKYFNYITYFLNK